MNKEFLRTVKYTLVAASAGVIQFGSFALLKELTSLRYWPCYLISLVLSVLWNFTLNRRYTFHSASNIPVAMAKVFGYYLVFTPLSTWGGDFLAETLGWNGYLVEILCMLVNFVTEFLFQRFVVFGKTIDTKQTNEKSRS